METLLALQEVLLMTVSLACLLHTECHHGVSPWVDPVNRVLCLL